MKTKTHKKITEKQNLQIRTYLVSVRSTLKDLTEHVGCYQSQLTGYLNGVPCPINRYNAIKSYCNL